MQRNLEMIKSKCAELLADGTVRAVIAWRDGEFSYDKAPGFFTAEDIDSLCYDCTCAPNLSKYLVKEAKKEGKVAVLLKPCDTFSFNQLLTEHRIDRDKVYVITIPCTGKVDIEKIRSMGVRGITSLEENDGKITVHTMYGDKTFDKDDVKLARCFYCKGSANLEADFDAMEEKKAPAETDKLEEVRRLEAMTAEERYDYWRGELSRCIRCNACRNVCPACTCERCVFDNDNSGVAAKANTTTFEENMFHIIRAFHVAGRCTDCGECSRVCPQNIPLHLLNRKFIKDIDDNYGEYQAGMDQGTVSPVTSYTKEDADPSEAAFMKNGGEN